MLYIFIDGVKKANLSITDNKGTDYTADFVGNWGALSDGSFTWSDDLDGYVCDQPTYDWWAQVIEDHQTLIYRIESLEDIHGDVAVCNVITFAPTGTDLGDYASIINNSLDEAFGVSA